VRVQPAGAIRHGITRALIDYDETLKGPEPGWLRDRDAREVDVKGQFPFSTPSQAVQQALIFPSWSTKAAMVQAWRLFFCLLVQNASPTSPC
jgi:hypothetical protein